MKKKKEIRQKESEKKNIQSTGKTVHADKWIIYAWLTAILLVSFIAYLPILHNSFIAWDDDSYITSNNLIHTINLKDIFSNYVKGNYHPLTILTYAIEYKFLGLNERGYHLINLLLHLTNVILVFKVILLLSGKMEVSLVACLLFGIHPIHVESVAWVAELKDLLYTLFFLVSYYYYLNYQNDAKKKFYYFALLFFLASLLSKAMAVSLPALFLLTDYFKGRKINSKTILEKVPFFTLSVVFGIVAIMAQKSAGATDVIYFTFPQRLAYASYSVFSYLYKLILPIQLSAYYPYPIKDGVYVTTPYYIYLLALVAIVVAVFYSLRYSKKIFFSFGFFAITIFLVLQLLPVGGAMMADRYCYIPSIGIFYLAGEGFNSLISYQKKWIAFGLLAGLSIFYSISTNARCRVWNNTMIFWNDVIRQYQTVPPAYYGRGIELMNEKRNEEAINDFNKAIQLKPDYVNAYISRGVVLVNENKYNEALKDFDTAAIIKPDFELIYINRGKIYMALSRFDEALKDYNKAIELKPKSIEGYYNRGTLFLNNNKLDEALQDFNKTLTLNPRFIDAYINRGIVYYNQKSYNDAIQNYTKAIELQPNQANAYYLRGLSAFYLGNKTGACADVQKAAGLGYQLAVEAQPKICN